MHHLKIAITAFVLIAVQGCVSRAQYTPMTQQTQDKIQSVEVYNFISQDEIRPAVDLMNATGALGGGLIGAMIDSSVNDDRALSARDIAEPLYNATVDMDFRAIQATHIDAKIAEVFPLSDQSVSPTPISMRDKAIEARANSLAPGEAFLFLTTHYSFVDKFKTLQTSVDAFLYVGETGKKFKVTKPDFHNSYLYQSAVYGDGANSSIALWAMNEGALFRHEMHNSAAYISEMLSRELTPLVDSPCAVQATIGTVLFGNGTTKKGTLLKQDNAISTVRLTDGSVFFVSNEDTVAETVAIEGCKDEGSGNA